MRLAGLIILLAWGAAAQAGSTTLRDVRVWAGPDATRIVFDLSGEVRHHVFALKNPDRLVIDLRDTGAAKAFSTGKQGKGLISNIRSAARDGGTYRVVLDLSAKADPRTFSLPPTDQYGHRLVVDLAGATAAPAEPAPVPIVGDKPIVIAIDPGHGGEDPGAHGPSGVQEKHVALAIARKLAAMVNATPGMRAVLTRSGDYYVGLYKRIEIARKNQADLFVSIHADAFSDGRARGSSIYVLSEKGATSAHARLLANRENAADLVGGIRLDDKDHAIQDLLVEISQASALEASFDVGERILGEVGKVNHLHKRQVQQANFAVLKAPDIPSILVETAFISNRKEERQLKDSGHQRRVASALMSGLKGYFNDYRPQRNIAQTGSFNESTASSGTAMTEVAAVSGRAQNSAARSDREHVIRRGDTLSRIAERYSVSLSTLRDVNRLRGDRINVGDVLAIPGS